jgi:hypothetical protein
MDETGSLCDTIDLAYHRRVNHQHITNAVVQELSDLIPSITALNLEDCFEVTDTGLWYAVRSMILCPGLPWGHQPFRGPASSPASTPPPHLKHAL